jgi:glyoxylase-like metal-dependent hydrolase (beta-lactamase superfamily II)/ferredoxin
MAQVSLSVPENVPGEFFVDTTCIDCDTCRQIAPATFGETGQYSFVQLQPRDDAGRRAAYRALAACPTASIGAPDKRAAADAVREFPIQLAPRVFYNGFNSPKSYGGNSYFVQHADGNWLIDSPRFVEYLARRLEEMGGVRYIFLTHRDDVADAAKWAARFGAERIIHRLELSSQPDAECVIDGIEPVTLAPEFLAIPTPGHTRGHCALLHREFLLTGDHLWWSRHRGRLTASRNVCWWSWEEQVRSVQRLAAYDFAWVLPGHGERAHFAIEEMRRQVRHTIAFCRLSGVSGANG